MSTFHEPQETCSFSLAFPSLPPPSLSGGLELVRKKIDPERVYMSCCCVRNESAPEKSTQPGRPRFLNSTIAAPKTTSVDDRRASNFERTNERDWQACFEHFESKHTIAWIEFASELTAKALKLTAATLSWRRFDKFLKLLSVGRLSVYLFVSLLSVYVFLVVRLADTTDTSGERVHSRVSASPASSASRIPQLPICDTRNARNESTSLIQVRSFE